MKDSIRNRARPIAIPSRNEENNLMNSIFTVYQWQVMISRIRLFLNKVGFDEGLKGAILERR